MSISIFIDDFTRIKSDDGTKSLAPCNSSLHVCIFHSWLRKTNVYYQAPVAERCEFNVKGVINNNRNSLIKSGTLVQKRDSN